MTLEQSGEQSGEKSAAAPVLKLDGLALWLVERGMQGLPLGEQIAGFCQRVFDSGFPMKRVSVGMYTLHPRYGSHTFVWRPGDDTVEHIPRERAVVGHDIYLKSPVHYLRSRGLRTLRRRLDGGDTEEFILFGELRAEGFVDYAAFLVPYDLGQAEAIGKAADTVGAPTNPDRALDGIFFSCATDHPEGFDDGQLDQVAQMLPYLALSAKSRLTYDVASTVLETYLGRDAGRRVLTGQIERGSAEAIRAVIWFSDLRGFTKLTDSLPRDELIATLDDYLEAMAGPVQNNGGQILKFMGDGLLATFDLTGRDEAAVCGEALRAAAELRRAFPVFNEVRRQEGKPIMDVGLALHLGEVLYGNIGASERLDFTVVGPAVNEASRIQTLCRPLERSILISSTFKEAADEGNAAADSGGLISLGFHALRGVREPQELFTLDG
ncbi:adenylate/guanylate cyclase domain-containing protein [Pelagibius sp.]|uniref:adenylate/guanylate cyclase domain-containing protein n=1 Tax=Pelagibius sp. TaxID=1931238 RepID=UPI003BB0704D